MHIILIARLIACLLLVGITKQTMAQYKKTKKAPKDSSRYHFAIVPVLGVSPETGFTVATLGALNFKTGKDYQKSRLSNVMPFASFSFSGQIAFGTFYRVFSGNDRYLFQGRLIYNIGNAVYYGIGNDLPESNKENSTNQIVSFATRVFRRLDKNLFFGLQYQYVHLTSLERASGGLLETTQVAGFDGSVVSGMGAAVLYDDRKNILNPQRGFYAEMSGYRFNEGPIGEYEFTALQLDVRKYFQPFQGSSHTLAVQGFANFVIGDPPYNQLSTLGGPTIMRGYIRGRYREKHHLAMQAEYRFPIWRKFGMVVFGGVGDVYNKIVNFDSADLKASYGVGLRFQILPANRINLRLDYGRGSDGSSGIYLGIGEAF